MAVTANGRRTGSTRARKRYFLHMAELSDEDISFINAHGVPLSRVFDAESLPTKFWKPLMSERRLWLAYGVTPCEAAGHQLRTRKGHCVRCNPAALAFLKRHDLEGEVYIAYSKKLRLVKVGSTEFYLDREASLNADGYAGAADWEIRHWARSNRAGRTEYLVQAELRQHHIPTQYFRESTGSFVWANEVFRCSLELAKATLEKISRCK